MARDPWHFRRAEFAERVFTPLVRSPGQAVSLFAPRRAGKTEFLVRDLAQHAEARGHRVIYASFSHARLSPLAVLVHALEQPRELGELADRIRTSALKVSPKLELSASVPGIGAGAAAELRLAGLKDEPPVGLVLHLGDLLGRVSRRGRPTILLLDDVQELARSSDSALLAAMLKTALERRRAGLRGVFTGSRAGLADIFLDREAPLYYFAPILELPALGEPFVDHLLAVFRRTTGRTLDRDEMLAAFDHLHRHPYFIRRLVQTILYDPDHTVSSALEGIQERIAADLGYPEAWLGLTPIQRETARALATGASRPSSRGFRAALGAALGGDAPSAAGVQAALRGLERLGIVDIGRRGWEIADPGFGGWIAACAEGAG